MTAARLMRRAAAGVANADGFFGSISMLREFWAEDPSWSNPGDGNDLTTVRDNGSTAADLTAAAMSGGAKPTYVASGINSVPTFRFTAPTDTTGGSLSTTTGTAPSGGVTVVAVAQADATDAYRDFTDAGSGSDRLIIGVRPFPLLWRCYNTSDLKSDAGTLDTAAHLFVGRLLTDDLELLVDGSSVGTDSSGTFGAATGFTLGASLTVANQGMDGDISYAAVYDGDLTAHADYSDYITAINDHYGF